MPATVAVLVVGLLAGLLAACGGTDRAGGTGSGGPEGTVTVAAAASLTEAFTALGERFEADHPGVRVRFTFDGSSALAAQIVEGAPVDVFASADERSMAATRAHHAGPPQVFARNRLVLVTRPGNPLSIRDLRDLDGAGVVALCADAVPCGRLAGDVLAAAGVDLDETRVTRGQSVKATLTAVTEGDAVAALVYETDARAAGSAVTTVPIPAARQEPTRYPIVLLRRARGDEAAAAFVEAVLGPAGQAVLAGHGFLPAA